MADKFSPWFIRDQSKKWTHKGFWLLGSEKEELNVEQSSFFIAANEHQAQVKVLEFEKVKVPVVKFKWYTLTDHDWKSFMRVPEFVEKGLQKRKEKRNNKKLDPNQSSLEDYDSMNQNIRLNCPHREWNLQRETEFETCVKCRMRRCLKCERDLSKLSGDDIIEHYNVAAIDLKSFIENGVSLRKFHCQEEKISAAQITTKSINEIKESQLRGLEIFEEEF